MEAALAVELAILEAAGIDVFDAHAHTGADIDGTTRSCDEHLRDLEAVEGRSVIFPLCVGSGYEAENARVVEECRRNPDRLVPFARLDPRVAAAGDATQALEGGARGFKLHPRAEAFGLDHPNVDAILGVAANTGAPVLVHAGLGVGSFGEAVVGLAKRHRNCPLILAHAGISDLVWLGDVAAEHPNLSFDTAWWNPVDLLALFASVPPGQILFGSDEPYMDRRLILAIALRCARHAGLPGEALKLVFGGQLDLLTRGEAPIDAGPAPGPPQTQPSPLATRVATALIATGAAKFCAGDPAQMLELARLGIGDGSALGESGPVVSALLDEGAAVTRDAVWALALAVTILLTPDAEPAAAAA